MSAAGLARVQVLAIRPKSGDIGYLLSSAFDLSRKLRWMLPMILDFCQQRVDRFFLNRVRWVPLKPFGAFVFSQLQLGRSNELGDVDDLSLIHI